MSHGSLPFAHPLPSTGIPGLAQNAAVAQNFGAAWATSLRIEQCPTMLPGDKSLAQNALPSPMLPKTCRLSNLPSIPA
jgi:hypothetical protein